MNREVYVLDPIQGIYRVYTLSISNLYHIEIVRKLLWYVYYWLFTISLYSTVHPMKYIESDVMGLIHKACMIYQNSLVPRPLPDFISQPWSVR